MLIMIHTHLYTMNYNSNNNKNTLKKITINKLFPSLQQQQQPIIRCNPT